MLIVCVPGVVKYIRGETTRECSTGGTHLTPVQSVMHRDRLFIVRSASIDSYRLDPGTRDCTPEFSLTPPGEPRYYQNLNASIQVVGDNIFLTRNTMKDNVQ